MKLYIKAMSETKREVERKLRERADEVLEHIMKLVLMPDHPARNHWRKEIAMQLCTVHRFKGSNKYPSEQQIFDWTYGAWADELHDPGWMHNMMRRICKDYAVDSPYTLKEFSVKVNSLCKRYFAFVAQHLSNGRAIPAATIYAFLDEIM